MWSEEAEAEYRQFFEEDLDCYKGAKAGARDFEPVLKKENRYLLCLLPQKSFSKMINIFKKELSSTYVKCLEEANL